MILLKREYFILALVFSLLGTGMNVRAERPPRPDAGGSSIDVQADSLEYLQDTDFLVAKGNVVIQRLGDTLSADYVKVNTVTLDSFARGDVVLMQDDWKWTGEELNYNFKTKEGDFGTFEGESGKYYIKAAESERLESGVYKLKNITVTTCDKDDMEFKVRASKATLEDGHKLKAYNVVSYLGPVPFFYLPYISLDLEKDHSNWDVSLGQSGDLGAFIIVGYRHKVNENFEHVTRVDLYSKRGIGVGENLHWKRSDGSGSGRLETFYLNDQDPLPEDYDKERFSGQVDSDRYRIRLVDTKALTDRDFFIGDLQYLSDPKVREDFFEEDFRSLSQPENRLSLSHRGDKYSAGALLNMRLNDFYENIDRKPELTLDFHRQELEGSGIYYQSQNSFVQLEKLFPDTSERTDFDTSRLDSHQELYYPRKYFGFLNVIPSVGGRATYYSDLKPRVTSTTNMVTMVDSNGVAFTTNQVFTSSAERGSDLRTFGEFGLESSFKAFKVLTENQTDFGRGLRHVVEPHTKYAYRSDPTVDRDEIYQFDRIDSIRRQNEIQFGARNKLQTRREKRLVDLFDIDLYTSLRLDPEPEQNDLGPLRVDGELMPTDLVWVDFDGAYDWDESAVTEFNARVRLGGYSKTRMYVNYGYRDGDKNLLGADLDYFPTDDWGFGIYGRYDIDDSELEESFYTVMHEMDCVGWEAGVRSIRGRGGEDDDNQLWLKIWLLAFPQMDIKFFDASY